MAFQSKLMAVAFVYTCCDWRNSLKYVITVFGRFDYVASEILKMKILAPLIFYTLLEAGYLMFCLVIRGWNCGACHQIILARGTEI